MEDEKTKNPQKQRSYFPRSFKRTALLEFSAGKKAGEILKKEGADKKYAPKLIHKWRHELYDNRGIIASEFDNIEKNRLSKEINDIGADDENDDIIDEYYKKRKKYT